jgi:hypothetical protein
MRGFSQTYGGVLKPNSNGVEYNYSGSGLNPTASGFTSNGIFSPGETAIYMAIRRPNKPPTTGTQVYATDTSGSSSPTPPTYKGNFPVDLGFYKRTTSVTPWYVSNRLCGKSQLKFNTTEAEAASNDATFDFQNGFGGSTLTSSIDRGWMFKRAPGFMDVVCYTGTGVARTVAHNLTVAPELIIQKNRSAADAWEVASAYLPNPNQDVVRLNTTGAVLSTGVDYIYNRTATSVTFSSYLANSGSNYVAYLFATLAGISKVGSYTGNGTSQNIECAFAAGARFVLVKATSTTGDWLVADTARGIVSGNDPRLSLNSTAAEVTDEDWLDPYAPGFTVNQTTASANASGVSYIFLAIS